MSDVIKNLNFNTQADDDSQMIHALRRAYLVNHGFEHLAEINDGRRDLKEGAILPPGMFEIHYLRSLNLVGRDFLLVIDDDTVADVFHDNDNEVDVIVFSKLGGRHAASQLEAFLEKYTVRYEKPAPTKNNLVEVGFWSMGQRHADRAERLLEMHTWADVERNYPKNVRAYLERLVGVKEIPQQDGKLMLMHGPAGTGKTNLIRALSLEWGDWTQVDVITDPETFLTSPAYLNQVMMAAMCDPTRWRVLIMEDCGELLGGDAKERAGQGLSRLLNISDGLLGQGQRLLFIITTNEDIGTLHPAVIRPGRCLANLHIGEFPEDEANEWLGVDAVEGPRTLAQLYQIRALQQK